MRSFYHIAPKRSGHAFVGRMIKEWCPNVKYVDCENMRPALFTKQHPPSDNILVILQTRDLMNWIASITKSFLNRNDLLYISPGYYKDIYSRLKWWWYISIEYYKYYSFYLSQYHIVRIHYDKFCTNERYRRIICTKLGGTYTEDSLLRVDHNGGGSSFDGVRYDGRANEMKVQERYKQLSGFDDLIRYLRKRRPDVFKLYKIHKLDIINTVEIN